MADAAFRSILLAFETVISGLTLKDNPSVQYQKVATDRPSDALMLPAIIVAPEGQETIDPNGGTNERDDIVYPVAVYDLSNSNQDFTSNNHNPPLLRRQVIRRAFHNKRFNGTSIGGPTGPVIPSVLKVVCEPKEITYPGSFKAEDLNAGGLLFKVTNREVRT